MHAFAGLGNTPGKLKMAGFSDLSGDMTKLFPCKGVPALKAAGKNELFLQINNFNVH